MLTKERMLEMGIACEDSTCCLCDISEIETIQLLFVVCAWSTAIWGVISSWIGLARHFERDIMQSIMRIRSKHWKLFQKEVFPAVLGVVAYHIWIARN